MIQFKCNICNRTIHLPENKLGMSHFGRCIITKNCRGKLFEIADKPNILRIPEPITVNDWVSTSQIFNYKHTIPQKTWKFKHKLNSIPSINVFINDEPFYNYVANIDNASCEITFKESYVGEVQCIIRNHTETIINKDPEMEYIKVSLNNYLTIAVHTHNKLLTVSPLYNNALKIYLNNDVRTFPLTLKTGANSWVGTEQIQIHGNIFDVYSIKIITDPNIKNNYSSFSYTEELPAGYFLFSKGTDKYDKVYDRFVDISKLNYSNNYIKNNDLFVQTDLIEYCNPNLILVA